MNPAYKILFRLMDRLRPDTGRCYRIREQGAEVDIIDIGEVMEEAVTKVKIAFPVSHNTSVKRREVRRMKDNRLKVEIAQRTLSDL